ncbi:hypothetical protein QYE76_018487 [Lolium multiflorum]|uniref:Uncharacterized protein n=1 Tax=Lolium multiflorum TaxID=4521 RepID=A0AAD8UV74_LOLMU|nr:hypothetical protein QYE76_018487 [Lolium multiflorum]
MLTNAWGKADVDSSEIQLHKKEISDFFDQLLVKRKLTEAHGASSSLATASSEVENLRSVYKDLETKLTDAETKREFAEKELRRRTLSFSGKRLIL